MQSCRQTVLNLVDPAKAMYAMLCMQNCYSIVDELRASHERSSQKSGIRGIIYGTTVRFTVVLGRPYDKPNVSVCLTHL